MRQRIMFEHYFLQLRVDILQFTRVIIDKKIYFFFKEKSNVHIDPFDNTFKCNSLTK